MGFIKGVLFGIAVCAAVQHITKKDLITGRSLLDDLLDRDPGYIDTVKDYVQQVREEFTEPASPI